MSSTPGLEKNGGGTQRNWRAVCWETRTYGSVGAFWLSLMRPGWRPNKYPPATQKFGDYSLFKDIVYFMNTKEHLTFEGLYKVLSLKASLNLGLSDDLKVAFPSIKPIMRPLLLNQEIPNPD